MIIDTENPTQTQPDEGDVPGFRECFENSPLAAQAFNNRGVALARKVMFEEAVADFSAAIDIAPLHKDSLFNRGLARGVLGKYEDAIADFSRVIEINPRDGAAYNLRESFRGQVSST